MTKNSNKPSSFMYKVGFQQSYKLRFSHMVARFCEKAFKMC